MSILLTTHSIVRWLAVLVSLALIIRLVIGLIQKQPFDKSAAALYAAFSGAMDTQMLLGILLLVLGGFGGVGFPAYRLEHTGLMVLAVAAAHLPARWKKAGDAERTRNTLLAVLVSLFFVLLGVGALGWMRWLHITGLF